MGSQLLNGTIYLYDDSITLCSTCPSENVSGIPVEYSGQSPGSPLRLDNVHGLSGHCPWTRWKVWTLSTDSLDFVQADWTMSAESMGSRNIVHGQSPLFVLIELVKKLEMEYKNAVDTIACSANRNLEQFPMTSPQSCN